MKFSFQYCMDVDISRYRLSNCPVDRIILDIEGRFVILIPAEKEGRVTVFHCYYSICDDENFDRGWIRDQSKDYTLFEGELYVSFKQGGWIPVNNQYEVLRFAES